MIELPPLMVLPTLVLAMVSELPALMVLPLVLAMALSSQKVMQLMVLPLAMVPSLLLVVVLAMYAGHGVQLRRCAAVARRKAVAAALLQPGGGAKGASAKAVCQWGRRAIMTKVEPPGVACLRHLILLCQWHACGSNPRHWQKKLRFPQLQAA